MQTALRLEVGHILRLETAQVMRFEERIVREGEVAPGGQL